MLQKSLTACFNFHCKPVFYNGRYMIKNFMRLSCFFFMQVREKNILIEEIRLFKISDKANIKITHVLIDTGCFKNNVSSLWDIINRTGFFKK